MSHASDEEKVTIKGKTVLKTKNTKPDVLRQVEIACKRLSVRAFEVLRKAMDDAMLGKVDMKVGIIAAKEVLDRGLGKAKQTVEANINVEGGEALIEALKAARERAGIVTNAVQPQVDNKPTIQ